MLLHKVVLDDNMLQVLDDCVHVLDNRLQVLDEIFRDLDDSGEGLPI